MRSMDETNKHRTFTQEQLFMSCVKLKVNIK